MTGAVPALSDREKETLRLLLGGHDAKSIARHLDLSVHTVNERLRDARRKLGVGSSREAARMLAEAEDADPQSLRDKTLGVGSAVVAGAAGPDQGSYAGPPLLWLSGGMLTMSLLIAAAALSSMLDRRDAPAPLAAAVPAVPGEGVPAPAGEWVSMLDRRHWDRSWNAAGSAFRSQMPKARWAATISAIRQPLGPVSSRAVRGVTRTTSLPGAPVGDYQVIEFGTDFANRRGAVETVVLSREASGWRVNGYFIR